MEHWRVNILQGMTQRERRLWAANYLFKFLTQPWLYKRKIFIKALRIVIKTQD